MAKTRKVYFDLFQLQILDQSEEQIEFDKILLKGTEEYKTVYYQASPVVEIEKSKEDGKFIFGTLALNQMNDLPSALDNDTKKAEQLSLTDNQGLAHYTSFLFDKELNIIVYEVKQGGVSIRSFCEFYEANNDIMPIDVNFVAEPIELKHLASYNYIRKLSVRVENSLILTT